MELRLGWQGVLWSLLLSFFLGAGLSWIYQLTHQGLSYVRSFAQTIALSGIVSAMVMLAIGSDVARGLGLVGALTVIRFRTNLKDGRDLIFVFASLASGVACGVGAFPVALVGAGVFSAAAVYVSWSGFGGRRHFDAVLRLHLPVDAAVDAACRAVLARHCRSWVLVSLREAGIGAEAGVPTQEHAYQIRLVDPAKKSAFLAELHQVPGLGGVSLLLSDASLEA